MNLLSTGNTFTEINLCKSKSTLIVGDNGAGKSTILDALSFVLYGKPFRKINKPQLLNSINNKGLLVECEFDIGKAKYKVRRGIKPTVFEVYQNDVMINQNADSKEYQEMFEKQVIKLNHKSFSQIVILGSASFTPFMQLSASSRREVIEDLLDIQIFSTMNTLLKAKIQENKDSLNNADGQIHLSEQKIELFKQNIEKLKQNNDHLIAGHRAKIQEQQTAINTNTSKKEVFEKEIAELNDKIKDSDKNTKRIKALESLQSKMNDKKNTIRHDIDFYHNNDSCPTCKQDLDSSFKDQKVQNKSSQLEELEQGLKQLNQEMETCWERQNEIQHISNMISDIIVEINNTNHEIKISENIISSHINAIKSVESQQQKIDIDSNDVVVLEQDLVKLIEQKNELANQKTVLEMASTLLKDTGIKTKIIKQYIPIINKLINKYLASMDFFVNFELNESFEEKIKSRFRDEFSYESFSEGEKLRIDLALLFTWRAVAKLRNSASTNLLIMDEIFDSSLDNAGTEEFLKIINTLTADTNVFIISHKSDALYDKFHSVIKFEKQKNFSRIAQ